MKSIAFDIELMRPGCAIVQPALGATISTGELSMHFDASLWLTHPTPGMRVYQLREGQLEQLSKKVSAHWKGKKVPR